MKRGKLLAALLLLLIMPAGFSSGQSSAREVRDASGFSKISFGISGNLYIRLGTEFSVILEGDNELTDDIVTSVSEGRLVIKQKSWRQNNNRKVTVHVTMPQLEGLGVSGSGTAEIKDALKAENLELSVSGSGKIYTGDVEAGDLDCSISGSGDILVKGTGNASEAEIRISGSGNYTGELLKINSAEIAISGSGSCLCKVTELLEAYVSGSGNVTYDGNPRVDARVSGSGRVRSR